MVCFGLEKFGIAKALAWKSFGSKSLVMVATSMSATMSTSMLAFMSATMSVTMPATMLATTMSSQRFVRAHRRWRQNENTKVLWTYLPTYGLARLGARDACASKNRCRVSFKDRGHWAGNLCLMFWRWLPQHRRKFDYSVQVLRHFNQTRGYWRLGTHNFLWWKHAFDIFPIKYEFLSHNSFLSSPWDYQWENPQLKFETNCPFSRSEQISSKMFFYHKENSWKEHHLSLTTFEAQRVWCCNWTDW